MLEQPTPYTLDDFNELMAVSHPECCPMAVSSDGLLSDIQPSPISPIHSPNSNLSLARQTLTDHNSTLNASNELSVNMSAWGCSTSIPMIQGSNVSAMAKSYSYQYLTTAVSLTLGQITSCSLEEISKTHQKDYRVDYDEQLVDVGQTQSGILSLTLPASVEEYVSEILKPLDAAAADWDIPGTYAPKRCIISPDKRSISTCDRDWVSYSIRGILGNGTGGRVFLVCQTDNTRDEFYAMKVLSTGNLQLADINRELDMLRWVTEASREPRSCGVNFCQKIVRSFYDNHSVFVILEYHPLTLHDPAIAGRLRLQLATPAVGLSASVSLPLCLQKFSGDSHSANREVLRTLRLVAAELVLGLLFLHDNGIVHQDLKPANILVSHAGHIVIGDFGAAVALPPLSSHSNMPGPPRPTCRFRYGSVVVHSHDSVFATPSYAAPELMERNQDNLLVYDERVDWWSLGVMLYELATGALPFQTEMHSVGTRGLTCRSFGESSMAVGELEKLRTQGGHAVISFEAFLKELLIYDPDYRLQDPTVKLHSFFDPIAECWDQVAALKLPPLPQSVIGYIDENLSLAGLPEDSDIFHTLETNNQHVKTRYLSMHGVGHQITSPSQLKSSPNPDQYTTKAKPVESIVVDQPSGFTEFQDCLEGEYLEHQDRSWDHEEDSTASPPQPLPSSCSVCPGPRAELPQIVVSPSCDYGDIDADFDTPHSQLDDSLLQPSLPLRRSSDWTVPRLVLNDPPTLPKVRLTCDATPCPVSKVQRGTCESKQKFDQLAFPGSTQKFATAHEDWTFEEKVTIAMLEAMDSRDSLFPSVEARHHTNHRTVFPGSRARKALKQVFRHIYYFMLQ